MKTRQTVLISLVALTLVGCATNRESAQRPPLVETAMSAAPVSQPAVVVSPGSLVPVSVQGQAAMRGLYENVRAAQVGDTLTVILDEMTQAKKGGSTNASRKSGNNSSIDLGFGTSTRSNGSSTFSQNAIDLSVGQRGNTGFDSRAGSTQSNQFTGRITVTVIERLGNGNLRVAGEKQLAVGAEEEIIRFGGVVSPLNIRFNTVLSSQVADARIEYRGAGITDEVQRAGWFTELFMRYFPN